MEPLNSKVSFALQASIALLTIALFWFAFIYYPKIAADYQTGKILPKPTIFKPVVARSASFPIQTENYRIVYEEKSGNYYAFVEGRDMEEFAFNRNNAKLALKNALSTDKLCTFNVIYASTRKLNLPQKYLDNSDC